jgi:hypothetical protein
MQPAALFLFGLLIATHAAAGVTYACVCASWIPCGYSADAEAVFVGEVLEATELTRTVMRGTEQVVEHRQVSRLKVGEAFFGAAANSEVVIETLVGNNSCKFPFSKGTKYLIYAQRKDGEVNLTAHYCSGSKLLTTASKDLAYLRGSKGPAADVSGIVRFGEWSRRDPADLVRLGITTVYLTNNGQQIDARIDQHGFYNFFDVAPGVYKLGVVLPPSVTTVDKHSGGERRKTEARDESEIRVGKAGCLVEDFLLRDKVPSN